jgi:four helix bundle protein
MHSPAAPALLNAAASPAASRTAAASPSATRRLPLLPLLPLSGEQALHVIVLCRPLVGAIARRDRDLASQGRRAASSAALNLAEGLGSAAGNSRLRFESARGSLYETQAGIRVAIAWGHLSDANGAEALAAIDHLAARLFGLCRR